MMYAPVAKSEDTEDTGISDVDRAELQVDPFFFFLIYFYNVIIIVLNRNWKRHYLIVLMVKKN